MKAKSLLTIVAAALLSSACYGDQTSKLGVESIKGILMEAIRTDDHTVVVVKTASVLKAVEIVPPLPPKKQAALERRIGETYSITAAIGSGSYSYKGTTLLLMRQDRSQ